MEQKKWRHCDGKGCSFSCLRDLRLHDIAKASDREVYQWFVDHGVCDAMTCQGCSVPCTLFAISGLCKGSRQSYIAKLAARNARVTTDALRSYSAIGKTVRKDVKHLVVNHSAKEGIKFIQDGIHTNNVEGMNAVLKRGIRRRFWQVKPRNSKGGHMYLMVFIENCRLAKSEVNPLEKLFSVYLQKKKDSRKL